MAWQERSMSKGWANLDSSCARRPGAAAGRDEETGFQIEQNKETDEGQKHASHCRTHLNIMIARGEKWDAKRYALS